MSCRYLQVVASSTVEIEEVARVLRASGSFDATVLPDGKTIVLRQESRDLYQDVADLERVPALLKPQAGPIREVAGDEDEPVDHAYNNLDREDARGGRFWGPGEY